MSIDRKLPWIIKYRPKRIAEVVNQEDAKAKFVEWLRKWPNVSKRAALLYGPPGCGKTSLVEAAAHEFGYELVEMNASDFRRKSDIERVAKRAASAHSLFGAKKKIVLLDEVDGIAGREDAGGLEAILQLIKTAGAPIVMTANDPWDTKLKPLRDVSEMIQFRKLSKYDVMKVLRRICENEELVCEEQALEYIAERSEGDLRAAINDLQAVGEGFGRVTLDLARAMLRPRDREHDPFETLRNLFSARYAWQAKMALTQSQLDYEQAKLWLLENIANQYSDPEDLARAYDALSKADVYLGRIVRSNDWDLLAYAIDMMTVGVAMAAQNNPKDKYRWVRYSFPQKLLLLSKTKEVRAVRDDIARVIASHLHISTAVAKNEVIPFLHAIFTTNPKYAAKLAIGLGLSEKMIELLAGPAKSEVLKYYREYRQRMESAARRELEEAMHLKSQLQQVHAEVGKEKEKKESKTRKREKTTTDLTAFFRKR